MSLMEFSLSYYGDNDVYAQFSQCEDYPIMVLPILLEHTANKRVLDAGCGTGKYIGALKNTVASITGIDQSVQQLKITKTKNPDVPLFCADLSKLPVNNLCFDTSISTWVLGTILDLDKRVQALNNLKQISNQIILVENRDGSEFEYVRGRTLDSRTKDYNNWLCAHGFKLYHNLESYFCFKTLQEAQFIFGKIWNTEVSSKIKSPIIQHDISIYVWTRY